MLEIAKSFKSVQAQFKKLDLPTNKLDIMKIIISGLAGVVIGIFTSAVVNSTLVEISLNPFFSVVSLTKKINKYEYLKKKNNKNFSVLWSYFHRNRNYCSPKDSVKPSI